MIDIQTITRTTNGYELTAYVEDAVQTRWTSHAPQEWQPAQCYGFLSDLTLDGQPFPTDPTDQQDYLDLVEWEPLVW